MSKLRRQLEQFKHELWKDQRPLATGSSNGRPTFIKHFSDEAEGKTELHVLNWLKTQDAADTPQILDSSESAVELEYVCGIRLFNLFVELDRLPEDIRPRGEEIKRGLIERASGRQHEIQDALLRIDWLPHWKPYAAGSKILAVIEILEPALAFSVDMPALVDELEEFDKEWTPRTAVPFRDAAPKNMVLAAKALWLGMFDNDEDARRDFLIESIRNGDEEMWLSSRLVDFDFASCGEISTLEDDFISLHFHERTWQSGPSSPSDVVWDPGQADGERASLSFITRYYRFGGRKAAYRLLHPWGHRVRFRHDGDVFYFERLPSVVTRMSPETAARFPVLMSVTDAIARTLEFGRPGIDQFIAAGLGEKRRYYVDMYWDRDDDSV